MLRLLSVSRRQGHAHRARCAGHSCGIWAARGGVWEDYVTGMGPPPRVGARAAGSEHLVSENASATEPASLLAAFVAAAGARLTTFDR